MYQHIDEHKRWIERDLRKAMGLDTHAIPRSACPVVKDAYSHMYARGIGRAFIVAGKIVKVLSCIDELDAEMADIARSLLQVRGRRTFVGYDEDRCSFQGLCLWIACWGLACEDASLAINTFQMYEYYGGTWDAWCAWTYRVRELWLAANR